MAIFCARMDGKEDCGLGEFVCAESEAWHLDIRRGLELVVVGHETRNSFICGKRQEGNATCCMII